MFFRWVEPDLFDRRTVAGLPGPAFRMGPLGGFVDPVAVRQDVDVIPTMALAGGHEADRTVAVF